MNFFGHAAVAAWLDASPPFLLGAMLPDFCSMARARLVEVSHPAVAAGVDLHHRTDAIFHGTPTFVSICRRSVRELTGLGVERGSARAVAHIGAELFLDGVLIGGETTSAAREAYPEALAQAREERLGRDLRFRDPEGARRFHHVRARLEAWGIPDGYGDPDFVAERLVGALRHRPRLALSPEDQGRVRGWLPGAQRTVVAEAPQLLGEVRAGLTEP